MRVVVVEYQPRHFALSGQVEQYRPNYAVDDYFFDLSGIAAVFVDTLPYEIGYTAIVADREAFEQRQLVAPERLARYFDHSNASLPTVTLEDVTYGKSVLGIAKYCCRTYKSNR